MCVDKYRCRVQTRSGPLKKTEDKNFGDKTGFVYTRPSLSPIFTSKKHRCREVISRTSCVLQRHDAQVFIGNGYSDEHWSSIHCRYRRARQKKQKNKQSITTTTGVCVCFSLSRSASRHLSAHWSCEPTNDQSPLHWCLPWIVATLHSTHIE